MRNLQDQNHLPGMDVSCYSLYVVASRTNKISFFLDESPATFETPRPKSVHSTPDCKTPKSSLGESSKTCSSDNHTLDSFLQKYTSEDNNSFHEIIEAADRKLRQKFALLYKAESQQALEMAQALALPSIEKQFAAIEDGSRKVDTWNYTNKNYIMYVPDGVELTKAEEIENAKRRMAIVHNNTRLVHNPFDEQQSKDTISELAKTQAKIFHGKIGVDGNTLKIGQTPQNQGFSYVKTPSPMPGVQDSPLLTWGEIEGTPFRLDGSDTPLRATTGPSFRITETSRRENLALQLAEKAGERMRGQKAKAIEAAKRNMASPYIRAKSSSERIATMSPAARRLATMRFGLKDSVIATPSPRRTPKSTPSPMVRKRTYDTATTPVNAGPSKSDLTDDLLKIPSAKSRQRAADFF